MYVSMATPSIPTLDIANVSKNILPLYIHVGWCISLYIEVSFIRGSTVISKFFSLPSPYPTSNYNKPHTQFSAGYVELPIRLDATVLPYNGDCYNLNTTAEREAIDYVVRETLKKSVVYNDYISP